jgi:hypothetical protein
MDTPKGRVRVNSAGRKILIARDVAGAVNIKSKTFDQRISPACCGNEIVNPVSVTCKSYYVNRSLCLLDNLLKLPQRAPIDHKKSGIVLQK